MFYKNETARRTQRTEFRIQFRTDRIWKNEKLPLKFRACCVVTYNYDIFVYGFPQWHRDVRKCVRVWLGGSRSSALCMYIFYTYIIIIIIITAVQTLRGPFCRVR